MAFGPPPDDLRAELDHGGAVVWLGEELRISEWEIVVGRRPIALTDLRACRVAADVRSEGRYALVLKTTDETILVGTGHPVEHLVWAARAIQEAEATRARREGKAGREYLFERVVPDEVRDLLDQR